MALSTFTDLQNTVATFLNRSNLTSLIPYFVQLTETKIAYGDRSNPQLIVEPLRIRALETNATVNLTQSVQTAPLPTGYLAARRFYLNTGNTSVPVQELKYVVPDIFWGQWASSLMDEPTEYTIEGENIVFGPTPDSNYTGSMLYYQKLNALVNGSDTNWLLTNAFGVYLNGTLAEAYAYTRQADLAISRMGMFAGGINALNLADKGDRYSGSPWQARPDSGNP